MPVPLIRHDSSHAERVRSGNLPVVVKKGGLFQVHWCKKHSDSSVSYYSSDESRTKDKLPWGAVESVLFETRNNKKGDIHDYFVAVNLFGEKVAFKIKELNVSIWELNSWTALISEMAAESKFELLGMYLNTMIEFEGFLGDTGESSYRGSLRIFKYICLNISFCQ